MSTSLPDLCKRLSAPGTSARELATALGGITADPGGSLPILVRPADPAFAQVLVMRTFGTERPDHLRLVPARPLSLAELKDSLGAPEPVVGLHPDDPPRLLFHVSSGQRTGAKGPRPCVLIAELLPEARQAQDDTGTFASLLLRPE
jgi:hypothetical protein